VASATVVSVPNAVGACASELAALPDERVCVLDVTASGNPALRPETSKTTAVGAVWAPSAAFSVSGDVYRSVRDHEIATALPAYVFDHPQQFPGFLVRNDQGQLVGLDNKLANLAHTITQGIDAELRWDVQSAYAGNFRLSAGLNYLDRLDRRIAPGVALARSAGYADNPRLTGVATLRWALGDWVAGANVRYIGAYALEPYPGSGSPCPDYKAVQGKCTVPPFTLVNLNLTYTGIAHWAFTGSVNNVFDHTPRYYDEAAAGYDAAFDDALGRYYALRVTYRF
jgi:iron complex outermembrane receptor protein